MSDYDPYSDPRHIPLASEIPAEEVALMEAQITEIEEHIQAFDQVLVMFQHPGWQTLADELERITDELDTQMRREQDQGTWKFYRGQAAQVEWFQSLPIGMAERQRRLRRDHAQLLRTLGKE